MSVRIRRYLAAASSLALLASVALVAPVGTALAGSQGVTRSIAVAGTSSPVTGAFTPSGAGDLTQAEFPGQMDTAAGPAPYSGTIVDRSLSKGNGNGVSVSSGQRASRTRSS